jgi:Zn-dependent metalloprotease
MMNTIGQFGVVSYANGNIIKGLNVNVLNPIVESIALTSALTKINANVYDWQDINRENRIREEEDRPTYSSYPKGKMLIVPGVTTSAYPSEYKLAWIFQINSIVPLSYNTVYVDAISGSVLYERNAEDEYTYSNSASGWTWYDGQFSDMRTRRCGSCTKWRLNDGSISTWSEGYTYPDNNNNWVEDYYNYYNQRKTAHSAHWAAQKAWDYYLNVHGRWGSDYNGKNLKIWPRTSSTVASYKPDNDDIDRIRLREDNTNITPPSGTNAGTGYSVATLEIIAHEYTHAMIKRSTHLNNFGDAGAVNEGICDIFGMLIEKHVEGSTNWKIGEKIGLVRRADDPSLDFLMGGPTASILSPTPSPSIFNGSYWMTSGYNNGATPSDDNGDATVVRNSGVLRKWFYLLANGGTFNGVTVPSLGVNKARDILYISFNWWLWSNLKYNETASQTCNMASYSYGECSIEHKAVIKAWKAVGINIANSCGAVVLNGPDVINFAVSDRKSFSVADVSESGLNIQDINWEFPSEWNVKINENFELSIIASSTINSGEIKAIVTIDGVETILSKWVHFSSLIDEGDNTLPPSSKFSNENEAHNFEEAIVVYPNPSSDRLFIATHYPTENAMVYIYTMQGRLVKNYPVKNEISSLDVSNLADGLYILEYKVDKLSKKIKFSIKH